MTAGERLRGWIDDTAVAFSGRLGGWIAESFKSGVEKSMDFLEPDLRAEIKPSLLRIRDIPGVPDDLKSMLDKTAEEPKAIHLMAILPFLVGILIGFGMQVAAPIARVGSYMMDKLVKSARIDPMSVITAWRRDPGKYNKLFEDLEDQGWSPERIEALKFIALVYPSRQDGIRYVAKEALEPEAIAKYGLMDEFDKIDLSLFEQIGVPVETVRLDWIAHWEHASWMQMVEMLHRGLVTEEDVYEWFRVVEMVPYWRDLLIQTAYTWPTRVDVRRWWDMRTIDETELRRLYSGMGYRGVNLDNYILWTKVYVAFPDLVARWRNGWITLGQVKSELTALGMPAARVDEMIETKIKTAEPERVEKERDLTKTDIYKGIKADRITRDQGVELLMDLGFDEDEADVLLDTNVPEDITDKVVAQRELSKTDIRAGLKAEELTEEDVVERLQRLRYSLADSQLLLRIFKATIKPPVEETARQLAKADITLGVKNGLLTPEDGYIKLQELGFTPQDAEYLLLLKVEKSAFSPVSFSEFKERTEKLRRAAGMVEVEMPEEVKAAADEVVRLTGEVEALQRSIDEEQRGLVGQEVLPEETTKRLKALQVKRNRAIATLEKAKSEYDRLVAEWKHGLP